MCVLGYSVQLCSKVLQQVGVLTETFNRDSGLYVLIVLAESNVIHMFWGRMADNVCKSSERMKNNLRDIFLYLTNTGPPVQSIWHQQAPPTVHDQETKKNITFLIMRLSHIQTRSSS